MINVSCLSIKDLSPFLQIKQKSSPNLKEGNLQKIKSWLASEIASRFPEVCVENPTARTRAVCETGIYERQWFISLHLNFLIWPDPSWGWHTSVPAQPPTSISKLVWNVMGRRYRAKEMFNLIMLISSRSLFTQKHPKCWWCAIFKALLPVCYWKLPVIYRL